MSTTAAPMPGACPYCSGQFHFVYHSGICPKAKAIEYWPDGTLKKVIFKDDEMVKP